MSYIGIYIMHFLVLLVIVGRFVIVSLVARVVTLMFVIVTMAVRLGDVHLGVDHVIALNVGIAGKSDPPVGLCVVVLALLLLTVV